jgi:FkbM family methyltransferase
MITSIYRKIIKQFYGTGLSKIDLIRNTNNKILNHMQVKQINVFGYKLILDKFDTNGYSLMKVNKNNELDIIKNIIKEGDIVIDVGANIGFFTLFFRSLVGNTGKIIAFEPEKNNFDILKKNIEINNLQNIEIHNLGLGSENKNLRMLLSENVGEHRIYNENSSKSSSNSDIINENTKFTDVKVVRLDDYVKTANFIKFDAEGYEIEILRGMPNLLKQNITIFSDFYVKLLKKHDDPNDFFEILLKNNFEFFNVRKNLERIDRTKIFDQYNENTGATDVLCKKSQNV